jgi:hypothetical protein
VVSRPSTSSAALALALLACGGKTDGSDDPVGVLRVGTAKGDPNAPPTPVPTDAPLTPIPVCQQGPKPFKTGFEELTLDGALKVTPPTAFALDPSAPISGKQSLRVDQAGTLAYPVGSACRTRLTLTIRVGPAFGPREIVLARIDAGSRRLDLIAEDGNLSVSQMASTKSSETNLGLGGLNPAPLGAAATTVTMELNLASGYSAARDGGAPSAGKLIDFPEGDPLPAPTIAEVDISLGTSQLNGTYWIDDVSIE